MDFIEAKNRFTAAINRLSISQNDKYAILGIADFINPGDTSITKKKEVKTNIIPSTWGNNSIKWNNTEKFEVDTNIRIVSKYLLTDKVPNVGDVVVDNNKVHYKIVGFEKDGDVTILSVIQ